MYLMLSHNSIGIECGNKFRTIHIANYHGDTVADYRLLPGDKLKIGELLVHVERIVIREPDYDVIHVITLRYQSQVKRFKVPAYMD